MLNIEQMTHSQAFTIIIRKESPIVLRKYRAFLCNKICSDNISIESRN